jgi:hypothetical protein
VLALQFKLYSPFQTSVFVARFFANRFNIGTANNSDHMIDLSLPKDHWTLILALKASIPGVELLELLPENPLQERKLQLLQPLLAPKLNYCWMCSWRCCHLATIAIIMKNFAVLQTQRFPQPHTLFASTVFLVVLVIYIPPYLRHYTY